MVALREVAVLSAAVGLVLAILSGGEYFFQSSAGDVSTSSSKTSHSALKIGIDRDKQLLFSHAWPGRFDLLDARTGKLTRRLNDPSLSFVGVSERNSTMVLLSEVEGESTLTHQVSVVRNQELVLMESLASSSFSAADLHVSADGNIVAYVSHTGHVVVWELGTAETSRVEFDVGAPLRFNSLSTRGHCLLVATTTGQPMLIDAKTGALQHVLERDASCLRSVAWSGDGRRVAIGDENGWVDIFDTDTAETVWRTKLGFLFPRSMALTDDGGRLAVGGFERKITIWNTRNRHQTPIELEIDSSVVQSLAFGDSEEELFAAGIDGTIRLWNLVTRSANWTFNQ